MCLHVCLFAREEERDREKQRDGHTERDRKINRETEKHDAERMEKWRDLGITGGM